MRPQLSGLQQFVLRSPAAYGPGAIQKPWKGPDANDQAILPRSFGEYSTGVVYCINAYSGLLEIQRSQLQSV